MNRGKTAIEQLEAIIESVNAQDFRNPNWIKDCLGMALLLMKTPEQPEFFHGKLAETARRRLPLIDLESALEARLRDELLQTVYEEFKSDGVDVMTRLSDLVSKMTVKQGEKEIAAQSCT